MNTLTDTTDFPRRAPWSWLILGVVAFGILIVGNFFNAVL